MTQPGPVAPPVEVRVRPHATPAEIAAVLVAVESRAATGQASRETPPWLRAGLREGLGHRPAAEPADLRGR